MTKIIDPQAPPMMNWTNSIEERGWIGEDGYKVILIDFHAGRAFWKVYRHDKPVRGGEFDADDLDKAKAFAERHPPS